MQNAPAIKTDKIMELLATGNIDQFTASEKVEYVTRVCEATGLSPLTRPFEFLRFQNKTVLYAGKGCTDQLRKIHGISIRVTEKKIEEGVLFITVEATDKTGRVDSDIGALPVGTLKGDAMANAIMKCITKAKRRVTLSICGLGMLDESELDTMGEVLQEEKQESIPQIEHVDFDKKNESIADIKSMLTVLAKDKSPNEKGQLMISTCKVNKFDDLKFKSGKEIYAIQEELLSLMSKKAPPKSAKDASFKVD